MSDEPKRPSAFPHVHRRPSRKGGSGEHPAVQQFRDKLESISEDAFPALERINERLDRLKVRSSRPPIPREEPEELEEPESEKHSTGEQ